MPDVTILRPTFSLEEAVELARDLYNLNTTARELPSERDQNFHLAAADGQQYILKIAGLTESLETLELENALMTHLNRQSFDAAQDKPPISNLIPKLVLATTNKPFTHVSKNGIRYPVRLITHLPGKLLAHTTPHSPALLPSLGRPLRQIDAALANF